MRVIYKIIYLFVFYLTIPLLAFANYDAGCLRSCFCTRHDCTYCTWACYYDYYTRVPRYITYPDNRDTCEIRYEGQYVY